MVGVPEWAKCSGWSLSESRKAHGDLRNDSQTVDFSFHHRGVLTRVGAC